MFYLGQSFRLGHSELVLDLSKDTGAAEREFLKLERYSKPDKGANQDFPISTFSLRPWVSNTRYRVFKTNVFGGDFPPIRGFTVHALDVNFPHFIHSINTGCHRSLKTPCEVAS